jgi:glyoxylase-like metal-dependent hydrolase (beta-lactamase superfamily II)
VQNSSRQDQIKSVRNLYQTLPEHTKVYPGHGKFTDIGSEKRENKRITENGGEWL